MLSIQHAHTGILQYRCGIEFCCCCSRPWHWPMVPRTCYKKRRGPRARPKRWSLGIKRSDGENWRKHAQAQTYAIQCLYIQAVWQGVAQDGWCRFGRAAGCLRIKLARLTNGPIHHQIIQLFQISTGFHCMICGWMCHDVSVHLVPSISKTLHLRVNFASCSARHVQYCSIQMCGIPIIIYILVSH